MTAVPVYNTSFGADFSRYSSGKGRLLPTFGRSYHPDNVQLFSLVLLVGFDSTSGNYVLLPAGKAKDGAQAINRVQSAKSQAVVTVRQMVETTQSVFALTAAQTAQCVGVSRAALYKHLNNEAVRDMEAYSRVYRLAERVQSEIGSLDRRYMSVLVDGKTLMRHLSDKRQDAEAIVGIVRQIRDKLSTRKNVGIAPHKPSVSEQRLAARSVSRAG